MSDTIENGLNAINGLLNNSAATAIGGAVLGSALTGAVIAGTRSSKKKRKSSTRKKRSTSSRKKRKRSYARTAGKRKDRSTKRIRMTKTGQPYVILASGKARFIKKSSARNSRRRKGGRY